MIFEGFFSSQNNIILIFIKIKYNFKQVKLITSLSIKLARSCKINFYLV